MSARARPPVPPYFDYLIEAFRRGEGGRWVHLGHWDEPPADGAEPGYDAFLRAQQRLDAEMLGMAGIRDGDAVLDIGCGFGGTLAAIDRAHRGMELTGVNVDERQLDICRGIGSRNGNELRWQLADACALPFDAGCFDRVLCIEAMFHFDSRRRFFTEVGRVLKPEGVLVASDIVLSQPAPGAPVPPFPLRASIDEGFGPWPDPWGDDADHEKLAGAAGMRCDRIRDATAETRPSHRFTVPAGADPMRDPGDPVQRAALALRWLHEEGLLRYLYLRCSRPS